MKKYGFTGRTISVYGKDLQQIIAVRSFGDVNTGDVGGFVESEENLSHSGKAWVHAPAYVMGSAIVCGDAQILGNTEIRGHASVSGNSVVKNCVMAGFASVDGNSLIDGVLVRGTSRLESAIISREK